MVAWIDSHCHLQWEPERPDHPPADPEGDLARAADAGVAAFVCVGTDLATSRAAVELAERHPNVYATVGLHPHDASRLDAEWDDLVALARSSARVVAIGEAGFDLHYEHSPRDAQARAFAAQIALAHELDRALVIHTRDAWDDTFRVLAESGVPARTIFHCFTGGVDEARRALAIDALLSFSGIVSFASASDVREAAAVVPRDALLVETDAPFLAPVPHRGKRNEPALVPVVGAALAAARDESVEIVADATRANATRVFALSPSA
ncbi:MAG TPA: TatD family hydrolase [Acidimicrobiia bacterium]|jgi:TatD DNase family protein|nr:TatD family hydrolase [Acidimicrobiia bacterium]